MVDDKANIDLSVVIPAFNEQRRILATLEEIRAYASSTSLSLELIVVDDGSKDLTVEVLEHFSKEVDFCKIIKLPVNMGKGAAVRAGVLEARGDLVLFADADGSTPIVEVARLIGALKENQADIAIGSRALLSLDTKIRARFIRKLLGRIFNFFVNLLAVPDIQDTQCGFKLFKRSVVPLLFSKQRFPRFSFDIEILWRANKAGIKVVEVPVNWHHVAGSKVSVLRDGIRMLKDALVLAFSRLD